MKTNKYMNGYAVAIGLAVLCAGIAGIYFVTIPNVMNIGHQAQNVANSTTETQVVKAGVSIAVSGFLLWLTTGVLIVISIIGIVILIWGLVE